MTAREFVWPANPAAPVRKPPPIWRPKPKD